MDQHTSNIIRNRWIERATPHVKAMAAEIAQTSPLDFAEACRVIVEAANREREFWEKGKANE